MRKKEGPTKINLQKIQQWTERGYICVGKFPGNILYVQRKCVCGDCIESQYDNHFGGKKGESGKGGTLVTEIICAIYNIFDNVMLEDDIKRVEILEEKIHYLYASIVSIDPFKIQHQVVQVMLKRVTNKKL